MKASNIFSALFIMAALTACDKGPKVTYSTSPVEKQNITTSITATGTIEPVTEVEVGTQVSGIIDRIYVDYNSKVTKGQLIAELDKSTLNERLTQTLANEKSSEAALTLAQQTYNRTKELYEAKAATLKEFEQATSQLVQAQSSYENAKTNVREHLRTHAFTNKIFFIVSPEFI